jgi:acyl-CoA reductase-like NAD-dependent aldehyde dehydrogenase
VQRDAEQENVRDDQPDACREKFLDDAVAAAERASGKKLNQPNRHIVLNRARAQIESQRHADRQRALREEERQQAEFTWSRPRSPRR